jgi:hypothetical protein
VDLAAGRRIIVYLRDLTQGRPREFECRLPAKFPVSIKTPRSRVYQDYEPEIMNEAEPGGLVVFG